MKKFIALILSVVILVCMTVISPVYAASALPESSHDYENDFYGEWTYSYGSDVAGLLVTFSEDTFTEHGFSPIIFIDDIVKSGEVTVGSYSDYYHYIKSGDYICIFDGNDNRIGTYDGDELAGQTVFVPGSSFKISLTTDGSATAYGFKVTDVSPCPDSDVSVVTYHKDSGEETYTYYKTGDSYVDDGYDCYKEGCCFVGWTVTPGSSTVDYTPDEPVSFPGGKIDLYPVFCKLVLDRDEIFYFSNSSWYFNVDGEGHYYMTEEDYREMQINLYKTYGIGPYPSIIVSIVLATYPDWDFAGSCYGISAVTALQHFGKIDVLSLQDADCMYDMDADEELISFINYYQSQAATSFLTENKAYFKGTLNFKNQLKALYDSAADGNLCIFSFYHDTPLFTTGHTILVNGAFTDADGNHVLVVYDCNHPYDYRAGYNECRIIISPDFKTAEYEDEEISGFNWTDNFDQFESFDINGNGSPLVWYKSFFEHIGRLFKILFAFSAK